MTPFIVVWNETHSVSEACLYWPLDMNVAKKQENPSAEISYRFTFPPALPMIRNCLKHSMKFKIVIHLLFPARSNDEKCWHF